MTYIGKTARIATVLRNQIPKLKEPTTLPIERRYLFTGDAGLGKSTLAEELGLAIAGHKLGVEQLNGQSMSVETVREWQLNGNYHPMFGDCRVIIVDEIDAASPAALSQCRTWLDKLAPRTVVIATTNKKVNELPEQLQSRFKVSYFEPVPAAEIKAYIIDKFNLTAQVAGSIAVGCKGNVRAAECDARSIMEAMA